MNIVDAPNQLLYADPPSFIRKKVLPTKRICATCESKLVLEHESDLYAHRIGSDWVLAFDCMVCKERQIIPDLGEEGRRQERLYAQYREMDDETYEQNRLAVMIDRSKIESRYREMYRKSYGTFIDYGKYLPAIPPPTKPDVDMVNVEYEKIMPYYIERAKEEKKTQLKTPDVSIGKPSGNFLFGLFTILWLAGVGATIIFYGEEMVFAFAATPIIMFALGFMFLEE